MTVWCKCSYEVLYKVQFDDNGKKEYTKWDPDLSVGFKMY